MSGIEIAGVLLGAFPLCISAMEHYEEMRKVAGDFRKIRRAHRRDLGKIKDCQLLFKLNLKELLLPLLQDEVIDKMEYELLLLHPGGPAWKNEHVELALKERLCECHDRYVEIMSDMRDTMTELCDSAKVEDIHFQQRLKSKRFSRGAADDVQQARDALLQQANRYVTFQAKRTQYAFTGSRRENLLDELEGQNNKLQNVLAANDRVSAIAQQPKPKPTSTFNSKALRFWRHANDIYSILKKTWHCTCRSCLSVWLQHSTNSRPQMSLVIPFCHGRRSVNFRLSEAPPSLQLCAPRLKQAGKMPLRPSPMSIRSQATSVSSVKVSAGHQTSTVIYSSQTQTNSRSSSHVAQGLLPAQATRLHLKDDGLCRVFSCNTSKSDCLGTVHEGGHEYAVYPCARQVSMAQGTSLADILQPNSQFRVNRVQRYGVALTLASSHLQLHSTPWLKEQWTSEDVFFPTTKTSVAVLHGEPYILAKFDSNVDNPQTTTKDRSFSTLGIVLLELCFGYRLEDHSLWSNPSYAPLQNDPMLRQTVACEWLEDVQGEAGEDYANAVTWTLKQSPVTLKDDKWREEFAQNVVQPLQRYYEYLHPNTGS